MEGAKGGDRGRVTDCVSPMGEKSSTEDADWQGGDSRGETREEEGKKKEEDAHPRSRAAPLDLCHYSIGTVQMRNL